MAATSHKTAQHYTQNVNVNILLFTDTFNTHYFAYRDCSKTIVTSNL